MNEIKNHFSTPYPEYDVMKKWNSPSWNDQTREVVGKRLTEIPERCFLSEKEWMTLEAVCMRLIPQPDRPTRPVPIVPFIDLKLAKNRGDGYRYEDMPPLRDAWRLGIQGIDDESWKHYGQGFCELGDAEQDDILSRLQRGDTSEGIWQRLPAKRFFKSTLLETVVGIYYSHPAAWSEIGYGGPASPRGYVRLGPNQRDPWEAEEDRD